MTVTTNQGLNLPATGDSNWNTPLNANFSIIDKAFGGNQEISVTGVTATPVAITLTQYQNMLITFTGILTANATYQIPAGIGGCWIFNNAASGAYTITVGTSTAGVTQVVLQDIPVTLYSDGTNIIPAGPDLSSGGTITGNLAITNTLTAVGTITSSSSVLAPSFYTNDNSGAFGYVNSDASIFVYNATGSSGITKTIILNTDNTERLRVTSAGNVGIGTSTPSAKLEVNGSILIGNAVAYYGKNTSGAAKTIAYIDSSNHFIFGDSSQAGSIFFYNNGINSATINLNGNLTVGTTAPSGIYNKIGGDGFLCRNGTGGTYSGESFNIQWDGSKAYLWINGANLGQIYTF